MSVNSYIDHTLLKADANKEQILSLIDEAKVRSLPASVLIQQVAKRQLNCLKIVLSKFVMVIGFPWEHRLPQLRHLKSRMLLPMGRMKLIWYQYRCS